MQKMTDGGTDTALRLLVARDSRVSGEEAEWHYCEFHGTPRFRSGYCAARIGQYISDPPRFCRAKETIVPDSPFTLEFRESLGYTENSCICPTAAKESSKYLSTRFRGLLHRPPLLCYWYLVTRRANIIFTQPFARFIADSMFSHFQLMQIADYPN